jgi:hypothetical protein
MALNIKVARLIHFSRVRKNSYIGLVHEEENGEDDNDEDDGENDDNENLLNYECIFDLDHSGPSH